MPATSRLIVPAWVQDTAIAVGVALLGFGSGLGTGRNGHLPAASTALLTAMGLALLPRRRSPGAVVALEAALVATLAVMHTSLEAAFIAVLVASYSAAVYGSRLLARVLLVAAVAAVAGLGIPAGLGADQWLRAHYPVPTILAAAGAWLVGLMVRKQLQTRTEHVTLLAERAELLAARQAESERRATLAERLRIAREMHDIVAHRISVVVIQAQGAQRVADSDPGRAKTAMADVERTSRTALRRCAACLACSAPVNPPDKKRGPRTSHRGSRRYLMPPSCRPGPGRRGKPGRTDARAGLPITVVTGASRARCRTMWG